MSPINDRYRLCERLGAGVRGEVWVVDDLHLEVERALRRYPLEEEPQERERRFAELRRLIGLDLPGVVKVHDVFDHYGLRHVVMERCEESLLDRVRREPLAEPEVVELGLRALETLGRACREGILHGAVKPSNLLLSKSGEWRLGDFGGGLAAAGRGSLTRTNAAVESAPYMAPEQRGGSLATSAADQYGLAATMYFALTGRPPGDLYISNSYESPSPSISGPLKNLIQRAGALDPVERFESIDEMAEALRELESSTLLPIAMSPVKPSDLLDGRLALVASVGSLVTLTTALVFNLVNAPESPPEVDDILAVQRLRAVSEVPLCDFFSEPQERSTHPANSNAEPGLKEVVRNLIVDLDGDGAVDVVHAGVASEIIRVFWGDGSGRFGSEVTDIPSIRATSNLAAGDLDGDGLAEIVATNSDYGEFGIHWGEGGRLFGAVETFSEAGGPGQATVIDWNLDGRNEVIFVQRIRAASTSGVMERRFSRDGEVHPFKLVVDNLTYSAASDADGDGLPEIFGVDDAGGMHLLERDESGEIREWTSPLPAGEFFGTAYVGAASEDGYLVRLVPPAEPRVGWGGQDLNLTLFVGFDGDGFESCWVTTGDRGVYSNISAGDLNGDGTLDLVWSTISSYSPATTFFSLY